MKMNWMKIIFSCSLNVVLLNQSNSEDTVSKTNFLGLNSNRKAFSSSCITTYIKAHTVGSKSDFVSL